jgi:hypothetical protein
MVYDDDYDGPWRIATPEGRRRARQYNILPAEGVVSKRSNRTKLQLSDALQEEAGITVDPL